MKYLLATMGGVALVVSNASAQIIDFDRDWKDSEISQIKTGVGATKDVTDDIKLQLDELKAKGFILRNSVEDIMTWLDSRRDDYMEFVGNNRCGSASPCGSFRSSLIDLAREMALLKDIFPAVAKVGLGDGDFFMRLVNNAPPFVLFGLHELMDRNPDWRRIPSDLLDIYVEIGDPEVFEIRLAPSSGPAQLYALNAASTLSQSPTQRFCERNADKLDREIDPVRLNRLRFFAFYLQSLFDLFGEVETQDVVIQIAGEGTNFINPVAFVFKTLKMAVEVIEKQLETQFANLDICRKKQRELELQVAQCLMLVDFIMPSTRDEVYNFVMTEVNNARDEFIPVRKAESFLAQAEGFRRNYRWKEAYQMLCQAYQKIGE